MNEMCTYRKPYACKKCGQEMLFFTLPNGMLIDYKRLLFRKSATLFEVKDYLSSRKIRGIKCLNCQEEFIIDWTMGLPEQLLSLDIFKEKSGE